MRGIHRTPGRIGTVAALSTAIAFALSACGSSPPSSTTTTTGATTTTASPTTSTSPSPSSTSTTTGSSSTGCASSGLAVTLGSANGSAGSVHYPINFRNTGSSSCTLYGFPGVSFLSAGSTQIGAPAQRESGVALATVTLVPGGSAYSSVGVTDPGIPPCSSAATATQVRVFPPGQTQSIVVPVPSGIQVCSSANTAAYQSAIVTPMTSTSF